VSPSAKYSADESEAPKFEIPQLPIVMSTSSSLPASTLVEPAEHHVVHSIYVTLRIIFGVVPIVAGLDKFTNFLADWAAYLNPLALRIIPISDHTFMHVVGAVEIIAGVLVLMKPRVGAWVVMAWLIAIALQLLMWGRFLDVAVRDLVIALAGALTLARISLFEEHRSE
jgi:uncharacterized membrane protein YphA (DoxX/SURF4 family)